MKAKVATRKGVRKKVDRSRLLDYPITLVACMYLRSNFIFSELLALGKVGRLRKMKPIILFICSPLRSSLTKFLRLSAGLEYKLIPAPPCDAFFPAI